MGFRIQIEDRVYDSLDFTLNEQSTPISGGTAGSSGTVDFTIPVPDDYTFGQLEKWTLARQNVYQYPRVFAGSPGFEGAGEPGVFEWTNVDDAEVPDAPSGRGSVARLSYGVEPGVDQRSTLPQASFGNQREKRRFAIGYIHRVAATPGLPLTFSLSVKGPAGHRVGVFGSYERADGSGTFSFDFETVTLTGEWQTVDFSLKEDARSGFDIEDSPVIPPGATSILPSVYFSADNFEWVTADYYVDQIRIGYDESEGVFDGWTEDTDMKRYEWAGEPNASESREFTGFSYGVGDDPLVQFGPQWLIGNRVRLIDTEKGFTIGKIVASSENREAGTITFTCVSRMGDLNVYNVQAQPFSGTLEGAYRYYMSLVDVAEDIWVEESIRQVPVTFPGWNGELWYHLKQMAASMDCDISLVSGVILIRPIRERIAARGRDFQRQDSIDSMQVSEAVEVYQYNNRLITTREFVYPPHGWNREVEVITANPGETLVRELELSSSLSSVSQPTLVTHVPSRPVDPSGANGTIFTAVTDDNTVVTPTMWRAGGGYIGLEINPDTTSLTLTFKPPVGLRNASDGSLSQTISLALPEEAGVDSASARYSTLRIEGTGVAFVKVKNRYRTGVPAAIAGNEIGATVDNPYISTAAQAGTLGMRLAKEHSGYSPEISGTVSRINRLNDGGQAAYPDYGEVQSRLGAELLGGFTYAEAEAFYGTTGAGDTYGRVEEYWYGVLRNQFADQVFGNINGARVWDKRTRRWYRIRDGRASASDISFQADDDLTMGDIEGFYSEHLGSETDVWSSEFDEDPFNAESGGGTWAIDTDAGSPSENVVWETDFEGGNPFTARKGSTTFTWDVIERPDAVSPTHVLYTGSGSGAHAAAYDPTRTYNRGDIAETWVQLATSESLSMAGIVLVDAADDANFWSIHIDPRSTPSATEGLTIREGFTPMGGSNTTPAYDAWYRVRAWIDQNGDVRGELYDEGGALLGSATRTPDTPTFTEMHVGAYGFGDAYYDDFKVIEPVPGTPATYSHLVHTESTSGVKWLTDVSGGTGDIFSTRVKVEAGTTLGGLVIYSDSLTYATILIDARDGSSSTSRGFQIRSGIGTSGIVSVNPDQPITSGEWYRIEAWIEDGTTVQGRLYTDSGVLIASLERSGFPFPGFSNQYPGVYAYGTVTLDSISVTDIEVAAYDAIEDMLSGRTYRQVEMMGLYQNA